MLYCEQRTDIACCLVPWQVGVVGNRAVGRFDHGPASRALLAERPGQDYPSGLEVIVCRGATVPIERLRIQRTILRELTGVPLTAEETVVLPSAVTLQPNRAMLDRLQTLDARGRAVAAA